MASTSESLALYQYLCQVIGTEEQVRRRRVISSARDYVFSDIDHENTMITSGSRGEGLNLPGSDYDLMNVVNVIQVYEDLTNVPDDKFVIMMDTIDTKKGFAKLRVINYQDRGVINICEREMEGFYISNTWLKVFGNVADCNGMHGPCILILVEMVDVDLALCFRCKSWIEEAKEWIFRLRGSWPRSDVIDEIIKYGVLFVPIGAKGSTKEHLEYRISFSMAEKQLIFSFNHTQLLVYGMMKILLKDIINKRCEIKDLLCSYFIKKILFWEIEGSPISDWVPCNLISCFMSCFRRLIDNVKKEICLHYFIPENNLFENRFNNNERETLLKTMKCLFNDGWKCILSSQLMSDFSLSTIGSQLNKRRITDKVAGLFGKYTIFDTPLSFFFVEIKTENLTKLQYIQYMSSYNYRDILWIFRSRLCQKMSHKLALDTKSENKNSYKQYKTILPYILQGTQHDSVSGWLLLSSLFYRMKQYKKALDVLSYVMTRFTSDKLYWLSDSFENKLRRFHELIPENTNLLHFLKLYSIDTIVLHTESSLIPQELQRNCYHHIYIPPLVFGIIITFLCHYKNGNFIKCITAARNMLKTVAENMFISEVNTSELAISYEYLGLALKLLQRNEKAKVAYTKALSIYCNQNCQSCISHVLSVIEVLTITYSKKED